MQMRYILVMCILLAGCAQPPTSDHLQQHHTDFRSGINVVTDYITNDERTFLIIEVDNREAKSIDVWMEQIHKAEGRESISRSRFYTGNQKTLSQTFRLQKVGPGISEMVAFEVFDLHTGKSLFKTPYLTFAKEEVQ